jgi:hypothetical protein
VQLQCVCRRAFRYAGLLQTLNREFCLQLHSLRHTQVRWAAPNYPESDLNYGGNVRFGLVADTGVHSIALSARRPLRYKELCNDG